MYLFSPLGQGLLILDNATIRYSQFGINVGANNLMLQQHIFPTGTQTGGFLYCKNSTFENNLQTAISFAPYHTQYSVIQGNIFDSKFTNNQHTGSRRFIDVNGTNFWVDIRGNKFKNTSNFSAHYGIYLYNSSGNFFSNEFDRMAMGFAQWDYMNTIKLTYLEGNSFYNNRCAIHTSNISGITIVENYFYVPNQQGLLSGTGIIVWGGNPTLIAKNHFIRSSSSNTVDFGVVFSSDTRSSHYVDENTFTNLKYGVHSNKNCENILVDCNTFNVAKTDWAIEPQSIPPWNFQNGRSNDFTGSGTTSIDNRATNFTYYYVTGYSPTSVVNVDLQSSLDDPQCVEPFIWGKRGEICDCFNCFLVPIEAQLEDQKANYDALRFILSDALVTGADSLLVQHPYAFDALTFDRLEEELIDLYAMAAFYDTANTYNYTDSISKLLINHNTPEGGSRYLFYLLETEQFDSINSVENRLLTRFPTNPDIAEMCDYIDDVLVPFTQALNKKNWLDSNFFVIKTYADSGTYISPYAKVLTQYAADLDSLNNFHGTIIYPIEFEELSDTIPPPANGWLEISIYPNPFSEDVSLDMENTDGISHSITISLVDLTGSIVDSRYLTIGSQDSAISDLGTSAGSGYYFVRVIEDSQLIYYQLLKQ